MRKFELSPNGYYNYLKHRKNAHLKEKRKTLNKIAEIYHQHKGTPGYRQMTELLHDYKIYLSAQTVRKYMNVELNLKSVTRKKKKQHKPGPAPYATFDNLLNKNFTADKRNQKWCIDFTYIYFGDKKRYNCTIIDLYDRSVVASVNSNRINAQLAIDTVTKAVKECGNKNGMVIHSDRGSQFTSKDFVKYCSEKGIVQSMSKPGHPYDNAPMERYFNTLKSELLYLYDFRTEEELYTAITSFAYGWYNNQRPHSYNNGLPPKKVA